MVDGSSVDLVIEAIGEYDNAGRRNGFAKGGAISKITLAPGTSTTFEFRFADAATGAPVTLQNRAFTFFDIDGNKYRDLRETLTICGADAFHLSGNSLLTPRNQDGACTTYEPSTDDGYTNPTNPDSLTETQAAHSVTAVFLRTSSFRITAGFVGNGKNPRPILFAGRQTLGGTCGA
jgi:hypothetical protein